MTHRRWGARLTPTIDIRPPEVHRRGARNGQLITEVRQWPVS